MQVKYIKVGTIPCGRPLMMIPYGDPATNLPSSPSPPRILHSLCFPVRIPDRFLRIQTQPIFFSVIICLFFECKITSKQYSASIRKNG